MGRQWVKVSEIVVNKEDVKTCADCGQEIFIHKGEFFCSKSCLQHRLEEEKEEMDLVERWREEHDL